MDWLNRWVRDSARISYSGSNHFEMTKEITEFCPSGFTQSSSMAHAWNGCSQSSRFLPQARRIEGSGDENGLSFVQLSFSQIAVWSLKRMRSACVRQWNLQKLSWWKASSDYGAPFQSIFRQIWHTIRPLHFFAIFFISFLYLVTFLLYFLYFFPLIYIYVFSSSFFLLFSLFYMRSIFFILIPYFIFWFRVRIFIFFPISMQHVVTWPWSTFHSTFLSFGHVGGGRTVYFLLCGRPRMPARF